MTVAPGGGGATAQCTEPGSALTTGNHSITAVYSGDVNYGGSTSPAFTQVVSKGSTTVGVASSANPSTGGLAVTYTATVANGGSSITPTGTVTFKDGATTVCNAVALVASAAQCIEPASAMTSGTHAVTAVYSGDGNFTTSTGSLAQVVNPAPVTVSEAANPASPSDLGVPVTFTITLTAANSSAFFPGVTGTPPASSVTITDTPPGGGPITLCTLTSAFGTGTTAGSGYSTWECEEPAADMVAGTHVIGVSFAGDTYFGATTASFNHVVSNHPPARSPWSPAPARRPAWGSR